jgi:hypothetical protein
MNYLLARIWIEKVAAEQRQSWFHQHPFLTAAMVGLPLASTAFGLGRAIEAKTTGETIQTIMDRIRRSLGFYYSDIHSEIKELERIKDVIKQFLAKK